MSTEETSTNPPNDEFDTTEPTAELTSAKSAGFAAFPTTKWDLVRTMQKNIDAEEATAAYETLCEEYWRPVYQFLLKSFDHHEAQDVAQDFFLKRAIRLNFFLVASKEKGKLRNLILCSLRWHVDSYHRLNTYSERRGGQTVQVSLDHFDHSLVPIDVEDANEQHNSIDLAWAREMHDALIAKMHSEYSAAGKLEMFEVLSPRIGDTEQTSYENDAARLQTSPDAARVAVCRMRKRYRALRQQLVAALQSEEHR